MRRFDLESLREPLREPLREVREDMRLNARLTDSGESRNTLMEHEEEKMLKEFPLGVIRDKSREEA